MTVKQMIPAPLAVAIILIALLVAGLIMWKKTGPGAQAEQTEELIRKAFGGGGGAGPRIPPPPQGAGPGGAALPTPPSGAVPQSPGMDRSHIPPPPGG